MGVDDPRPVDELIRRSNTLGSDPATTNYGGGNTSAKDVTSDPVTGQDVEVMWVKGSGGDLGTLTAEGLSTLRLDRVRALKGIYPGPELEDEMHELLDLCTLEPGAAPSIDTSMHALLPKAHVDHLHPDSIIALAAAAEGEALTERCFGAEVAWVDWRRPGFELARQMEDLLTARPDLKGVVMGGHGLTTWGDTSEGCQQRSLELISRAQAFLDEHGESEPLGPVRDGYTPLDAEERRGGGGGGGGG
ncbi:MAG: class II aldolase/adducin family protein, partial [Nitriliruptoraceae bacterium]